MPPRGRGRETVGQETMFLTDPDHVLLQPRDFEGLDEAGQRIERDIHLLNVLSLFGTINQREFLIAHPHILNQQYGGVATKILDNLKKQRERLEAQAAVEFGVSLGLNPEDSGFLTERNAKHDEPQRHMKREWVLFQKNFRGSKSAARREVHARNLRTEITDLQSRTNRTREMRPHLSDNKRRKRELPKLSSAERLIVIKEDPRAGFMPTTNDEKTLVMSWLDYLDNPEYELGVTNQIIEVFNRQRKVVESGYNGVHGRELPTKTTESTVYRVHDYWTNAVISLDTLRDLDTLVDECLNPNVPLTEDIPVHPGFRALIRYRDLVRFRDFHKKPKDMKDPLLNLEDRRVHQDPGKRKTVEDLYTQFEYPDEMRKYIHTEASKLTIGEARKLLRKAIPDQELREAFHRERMRELSRAPESRMLSIRRLAGRLILQSRIHPITALSS